MSSIWATLGIRRTRDRAVIRRAYAARLKETNPEDDPDGFKALRAAYETALAQAGTAPQPVVVLEEVPTPAAKPTAGEAEDADVVAAPFRAPEPRVDPEKQAFQILKNDFEALLRRGSAVDDAEPVEALRAVLKSPQLDHLETRQATETWLLRVLLSHRLRSAALIATARTFFGWDPKAVDRRRNAMDMAQQKRLLQREEDLRFLKQISHPDADHFHAYRFLSRPPRPDTLWSRLVPAATHEEVRKLLAVIRRRYPTVEGDLDAETLRAWAQRMQRPAPVGTHLWMAILSVPCLLGLVDIGLLAWLRPEYLSGPLMTILVPALCVPVAWTVLWGGYTFGIVEARKTWDRDLRWRASPWLAYGWGVALIVLIGFAAIPAGPGAAIVEGVLALAVTWWVIVTGEPDRSPGNMAWQARLVFAGGGLTAMWVVSLWSLPTVVAKIQMTIAFATTVFVRGFGLVPVLPRWLRLDRGLRRTALVVLGELCAVALVCLWIVGQMDDWKPAAFALAMAAMVLHQVPTLSSQGWSRKFGAGVLMVSYFAAMMCGGEWIAVQIIGTVMLAWATINCGLAWRLAGREAKPVRH